MIKVFFNPENFPNVRVGISEHYDTLEGPVEFIRCNENIIEYDTDEELADFYANVDFRLFDDLCELFLKVYPNDDNYPIEDLVGHFFTIRQVKTLDKNFYVYHYMPDGEIAYEYCHIFYDKNNDVYCVVPDSAYNNFIMNTFHSYSYINVFQPKYSK